MVAFKGETIPARGCVLHPILVSGHNKLLPVCWIALRSSGQRSGAHISEQAVDEVGQLASQYAQLAKKVHDLQSDSISWLNQAKGRGGSIQHEDHHLKVLIDKAEKRDPIVLAAAAPRTALMAGMGGVRDDSWLYCSRYGSIINSGRGCGVKLYHMYGAHRLYPVVPQSAIAVRHHQVHLYGGSGPQVGQLEQLPRGQVVRLRGQ
ncbi:hypothetical protein VOLCADRAFT_87829 [Volvox carteri f. nagariensis]|uniref:Uncharacterized protein n=1 Tax=Volvox carteri f. nagariensis TaxID=3068 RepID=D8TMC9_VOLCA|nr:uncharacterized protein VOLCADRAFT_87829 [Volvox carteri f. nagariensis]EFJ51621.1 hypothetical protein VOLCADRAFT_87829 [Volvox carteri f. nagariensis]|eukprot:XP_002947573.1 hypothetical protein VOLCADRAFT_87829 [Volvox carteri f. nagariensis]